MAARTPQAKLKKDEVGVGSSVVAFLVAGVLFMASVVAVLVTTRTASDEQATGDEPEAAAARIQARGLADLLLGSSGYSGSAKFGQGVLSGYSGKMADADEVTRLGLLDPDATQPFMMDYTKFQNLRLAPLAAANDDYVNYNEAIKSLGLQASGLDFHVRAYPSLKSTLDILANHELRDDNLRVAYIADGTSVGGGTSTAVVPNAGLVVTAPTCGVHADAPKAFRIATTVKNGGVEPTQFEVIFDLDFPGSGGSEYHKRNTRVIAAGDTAEVFADAAALSTRTCDGLKVDVKVYDSIQLLNDQHENVAFTTAVTPSGTAARAILVDTSSENYLPTQDIIVTYGGKGLAEHDALVLTICPDTAECDGTIANSLRLAIDVPKKESDRLVNVGHPLPAGQYTVRMYDGSISSTSFRSLERLLITETPPGPYTPSGGIPLGTAGEYDVGPSVFYEVGFLEDLMGKFCPVWFDSADPADSPLPPSNWESDETPSTYASRCGSFKGEAGLDVGDIYPQDKKTLKGVLQDRLMYAASAAHPTTSPAYIGGGACPGTPNLDWTDILVVGSNVDHNKLTSADIKDCIGNWVLGGGTLIVFGSQEMSTHWLESVFHVAIESSSTGINVPDEAHPVLNVPNDLNWPSYDHDYAWRLKVTGAFDAESAFTRVVNTEGSNPDAVLAVSDPGGFQAGNVILTGWTPYDVKSNGVSAPPDPAELAEGRNFVHNLLMLAYRDLYLDYGPPIPAMTNVIPEVRNAQICHPEFDEPDTPHCDDPVPLALQVYVFPG